MKELITIEQANVLMLAILIIAPLVGLAWGISFKRVREGLIWGIAAGVANLILWKVYNAITDHLGLDTVKNLLVNLALFIILGLIAGFAGGTLARRRRRNDDDSAGPDGGDLALVGGPSVRGSGAAKTFEEAGEPPRDAG